MKKTSESKLLAKPKSMEDNRYYLSVSDCDMHLRYAELEKKLDTASKEREVARQRVNEIESQLDGEIKRADDIQKMLIDRTVELENERARHRETFAALRIARRMIEAATERREP